MTSQKSFKSRVRSRMNKTGESYTSARRHLLEKADRRQTTSSASAARQHATVTEDESSDAIRAQRGSDESIRERTGRSWDAWFATLDAWGAAQRTHTEIARWLVTEHQVAGWWAQSITVGYEQARGMRAPGQQSDGYFSASGSKTVAVSVGRLFDAFADESKRTQWLPDKIQVRTTNAPKSLRADWDDGSTRIVLGSRPKVTPRPRSASPTRSWSMLTPQRR